MTPWQAKTLISSATHTAYTAAYAKDSTLAKKSRGQNREEFLDFELPQSMDMLLIEPNAGKSVLDEEFLHTILRLKKNASSFQVLTTS